MSRTVPVTLLAWEGPQARAYLVRMSRAGLRPQRIVLMVRPGLARFGKLGMGLAERMQDLSHNHHPYRIRKLHPNLMERTAAGMAPLVEDSSALWREMYEDFSYDRYAEETIRIAANAFDHHRLVACLGAIGPGDVLFTGGGLLPRSLLDIQGLRMIHVHTGLLPYVRGADVLLWSLLVRGRVGVSAFVMSPKLDAGDVLAAKELPAFTIELSSGKRPDDLTLYRAVFSFVDPLIRAEMIVSELFTKFEALPKAVPQDTSTGITYHFMHPALRSRVLKKIFVSPAYATSEIDRSQKNVGRYQAAYSHPTLTTGVRFLIDAELAGSPMRRLAISNRRTDYAAARNTPSLLRLHGEFNRALGLQQEKWPSYDYGQGWFYQSSEELGITGLRDTSARLKAYDLGARVAGQTVLEIGCNSGFLSLALASHAKKIVCFEINPHLIAIARLGKDYLRRKNISFLAAAFEDFYTNEKFDLVISFANHHTYDQNTRQTIDSYVARCYSALKLGGRLLFESHPPELDGGQFGLILRSIEQYFEIETSAMHNYGTFLDRNRIFLTGVRREAVCNPMNGLERLNENFPSLPLHQRP